MCRLWHVGLLVLGVLSQSAQGDAVADESILKRQVRHFVRISGRKW